MNAQFKPGQRPPPGVCWCARRHAVEGRTHAYVSCCRSLKLRSLLSSVVGQLTLGGKRKRNQAFAAATGTEHSLLWELKGQSNVAAKSKFVVTRHMQQLRTHTSTPAQWCGWAFCAGGTNSVACS